MNIGGNIRELRRKMNLTQKELADSVGAAQPTIAQYERGTKIPTMIMGVEIARALGVDVSELYK